MVKLQRARSALSRAHLLLLEGRPNVWWRTWFHTLSAQLEHEWFALSLEVLSVEDLRQAHKRSRKGGFEPLVCSRAKGKGAQTCEHYVHQYVCSGLDAIRDGFDSLCHDPQREDELRKLWWKLFLCALLARHTAGQRQGQGAQVQGNGWPEEEQIVKTIEQIWKPLNEQFRLDSYFREELGQLSDPKFLRRKLRETALFKKVFDSKRPPRGREALLAVEQAFLQQAKPTQKPAKASP